MEILSKFDTILMIVMLLLSLIGLIRGFLKELASILNWFGSICLTALLKPFLIKNFLINFKFPFLIDIIANAILFVIFVLMLSIINKIIVEKIQSFIPKSTNSSLGFLFGFVKSIIIIGLFLGCLNIVFKDSSDIINKSLVNKILIKDTKIFSNIVDILFGKHLENKQNNLKNIIENTTDKIEDKIELMDKINELSNSINDTKKTIDEVTINNKKYKFIKKSDSDTQLNINNKENSLGIDNLINNIFQE